MGMIFFTFFNIFNSMVNTYLSKFNKDFLDDMFGQYLLLVPSQVLFWSEWEKERKYQHILLFHAAEAISAAIYLITFFLSS